MSRIAIADIKPTGVIELTAAEAHEIDGGWLANATGALVGGVSAGISSAITTYGDPYSIAKATFAGALGGALNPVSSIGTAGLAIGTGLGLGVATGTFDNIIDRNKNGNW